MIKGKVVTGSHEAAFFVDVYNRYFRQKLGFDCYPGTLNIQTEKNCMDELKNQITIIPEEALYRVDLYKVKINQKISGAVVVPEKTKHGRQIIELVAAVNLRKALKVKDGDEITCELE